MSTSVLLTGGAGYIGSHTLLALHATGLKPVVLDDFSNSQPEVLRRLEELTGAPVAFEQGSVFDSDLVARMVDRHQIGAVIHFAGFKAVGESVADPLKYYRNNVGGLTSLLATLQGTACRSLVFSSSATVYGDPASVPITEDFPRQHTNPYGHTKLVGEDVLAAVAASDASWRFGVLRYFNPVGAHPSGRIGESPNGIPNNLMPFVSQVAVGRRPFLQVFGDDYPTPDGTGVRDYIHVCDLAEGHVAAVRHLLAGNPGFTVNLGTGKGSSVLDMVKSFEAASGKPVPYRIAPRRPGDVAECYADPASALALLGWQARLTLDDMCRDSWRWQEANPHGYGG
ncbi:UDP-glucose 4-epimerase GalE [Xylophilus sp. GOD-11R]|uniref:UDP-glucose 4-epimerase GalE n=1 Tax=Xylophilus sp. GOD-11R TaxID=3089814 RepID=UPI00298CFC6D|nr:UDP-glucose 4-epimerase GalE [Xylophilus sp. GOD-11R]WPB58076.1 UDP-glucose 4-epimerase GalE [Xylophilus sp. GOD-11R]